MVQVEDVSTRYHATQWATDDEKLYKLNVLLNARILELENEKLAAVEEKDTNIKYLKSVKFESERQW